MHWQRTAGASVDIRSRHPRRAEGGHTLKERPANPIGWGRDKGIVAD